MSILKESMHVRLKEEGSVFVLQTPNGDEVGLSPQQAVHAVIEPHGNFGRSRVTVTLTLELEVLGEAPRIKHAIAEALATQLLELRRENSRLRASEIRLNNELVSKEREARGT